MFQRFFCFTLFFCLLTGCNYIKNQNIINDQTQTYKAAVITAPLKIPPNLTHSKIGSETETLPTNVKASSLPIIPPPPGSILAQPKQST